MANTIMAILVAIAPGVLEYVHTNGLTWRALVVGICAGLLSYLSPAPKTSDEQK